jgi:hypothetical protein
VAEVAFAARRPERGAAPFRCRGLPLECFAAAID